jgi:hypothetical protein
MDYLDPEVYKCGFEKITDFQDAIPVLELLGKFHAASYYLAEQKNYDFTKYTDKIYEDPEVVEGFVKENLRALESVMGNWEFGGKYLKKIDALIENCEKIGKNAYYPNRADQGYNVLVHGDYSLANLLRNKKDRNDLYLIDFQTACWCSPAVDFYFAYFQLAEDLRNKRLPDMIVTYHEAFKKTLENLKFKKPIPTAIDFKNELKKQGRIRTLFSLCFEPFTFSNFNEATLDDMHDYSLKQKLFLNKDCVQFLERELEFLTKENLL